MKPISCVLLLILLYCAAKAQDLSLGNGGTTLLDDEEVNETGLACPTWFIPTSNESCGCGYTFSGLLRCSEQDQAVSALSCYCVTHSKEGALFTVNCLYTCSISNGSEYRQLPADPSKVDSAVCRYFNRKGPSCGECKDGYAISAFAVYLQCVECPTSGWLKYFALTFLPLTAFYFLILFFRFRVTSPWLEAYIIFCQIITSPNMVRQLLYRSSIVDITKPSDATSYFLSSTFGLVQSLYGIWNLNFLQLLVPPFCLDPNFTTLQVIALDYLTAFYPLFLVLLSFVVLELHARNFKPLVLIWKPFRKMAFRFRKKVAVSQYSVVDSFATFLLLSYVKLIYVSSDLLHFVLPRFPTGEYGKPIWRYDGSVDYFGAQHAWYGVLALFVYFFCIFLPFLFLALYPCKCFQRAFPRLYSKPQIHAFVDCFQGHYKDGTNGTRDYRHFSSLYLSMRTIGVLVTDYVVSGYSVPVGSILTAGFGTLILVTRPYKKDVHNTWNGLILVGMSMWLTTLTFYHFPVNNVKGYHVFAIILDMFFCILPLLYFTYLMVRYTRSTVVKTMCVKRMKRSYKDWRQNKNTGIPTVEERAYSFPDRVVNPRNYDESISLSELRRQKMTKMESTRGTREESTKGSREESHVICASQQSVTTLSTGLPTIELES